MKNSSNEWTIVPGQHSLLPNVRTVWSYKSLFYQLVKRDVLAFYKQTILGPCWFFIQPIFTTTVFSFAFGKLARISTEGLPPPLFYLAGVICWNYFSECLNKTSAVFKDNAGIFGKIYFPRIIVPLSITISMLIRFAIQMLLFGTLILIYHNKGVHFYLSWSMMLLPILIILMAMQGLGLGLIIAALTTKYRDLTFLVAFGLQLLIYTTTVIYPLSAAPSETKLLIQINPMTNILETFRHAFLGKGSFSSQSFIYCSVMSTILFTIGIIAFNKTEKTFIDNI